jgi:hypothetical protein
MNIIIVNNCGIMFRGLIMLKAKFSTVLIITILLLSLSSFTTTSSNIKYESFDHYNLSQEDESFPVLLLESNSTQYGSNITASFGMQNSTNQDTAGYLAGYNYQIHLITVNDTITLETGVTEEDLIKRNYPTINSDQEISFFPGNYTLVLSVNDTERGILTASEDFEIYTLSNTQVFFVLRQIEQQNFAINRTEHFELLIDNRGMANAFNIEITIQSINDPVGLSHNSSFPYHLNFLENGDSQIISFTVTPSRYGIGSVVFQFRYSDYSGVFTTGIFTLNVEVIPTININALIQPELFEGNITTVNIQVQNLENIQVQISFEITSDKIFFFNNPNQIFRIQNSFQHQINGTILSKGPGIISLSVYFYDDDGVGRAQIYRTDISIFIGESSIGVLDPPGQDENIIIIFSFLLILFLLIIGTVFLITFNNQIRAKVISQILPERLNKSLHFPKNSIIIDGSNVAWDNPTPSGKANLDNLLLSINELKRNGFVLVAVIVDAALRYQVQDTDRFDKASRNGLFKVLPARVSGDLFILRLAKETGALILTNDLFKEFRSEFDFIDNRRIPFSIIDNQVYLHPLATDHPTADLEDNT